MTNNSEYEKFTAQEIKAADKHNPQQAAMMRLANIRADQANNQAAGAQYNPRFHKSGWKLTILTKTHKTVCLWFSWLDDQLYLGYPNGVADSAEVDEMIMRTLGVGLARPVLRVDATAVGKGYSGEYKDSDKPLEITAGQYIAYAKRAEPRLWAKFYGSCLPAGGRVWVDHNVTHTNAYQFDLVYDRYLTAVWCGHYHCRSISTFPFHFCNKYAVDGPTTDPNAITPYRDRFLSLMIQLAEMIGGAKSLTIEYGFVLVPEQLSQLDYTDYGGSVSIDRPRIGSDVEVVWGEKTTSQGSELLLLKSGNRLVPWSTIRHFSQLPKNLNMEHLKAFLTF